MTRSDKSGQYSRLTRKMLVLGLLAVCGIAAQTEAQEIVKGTFTLNAETRFGGAILPAGHYTVSVAPITPVTASGSRVSVLVRSESKSGPVVSIFALASQQSCESTPNGLTLLSDNGGLVARSMCLEKQGLMVDFDLSR